MYYIRIVIGIIFVMFVVVPLLPFLFPLFIIYIIICFLLYAVLAIIGDLPKVSTRVPPEFKRFARDSLFIQRESLLRTSSLLRFKAEKMLRKRGKKNFSALASRTEEAINQDPERFVRLRESVSRVINSGESTVQRYYTYDLSHVERLRSSTVFSEYSTFDPRSPIYIGVVNTQGLHLIRIDTKLINRYIEGSSSDSNIGM
jgi:hypothetical protein